MTEHAPNPDVKAPTALITGATSGIGRAATTRLARDGFDVIVHGRDATRGADVVADIVGGDGRARFVAADLGDADDVIHLAESAGDVDSSTLSSTMSSTLSSRDSLTREPSEQPESARSRPRDRWHLPSGVALYLQASIILFFLAGSSAPTPLYAVYQAEWHFTPITTTVVFGVYALAVLVSLLVVGRLSDHVGRRPVLLAAIALQAVTMLVFVTASGVPTLLVARVIQGLSTGAAAGAIGAGMLDINRTKGTIANAVAPLTGTAAGALLSGLAVQFLPSPTHLIYLVLFGVFVLQGIGVVLMAETSAPTSGALASLRPRFGLPPVVRRSMLVAGPALVAVWSLAGLYGSLGPAVVRIVTHSNSLLLGGLALFTLAISGGITVLVLRPAEPRRVMAYGGIALFVGVGVTLLAIFETSTVVFFLGAVVAGSGFGAGFQGAIRTVLPLAAPHERAGVLSIMYVISYLAMGLPAVIAGFLVVDGGGVLETAERYSGAVMILAAIALAGLLRRPAQARVASHSHSVTARADAVRPATERELTDGPQPIAARGPSAGSLVDVD